MKTLRILPALLVGLFAGGSVQSSADADPVEGTYSVYTEYLTQVLERWPSPRGDTPAGDDVSIACLATAGADKYVGMLQRATIRAPLSLVESVLDDVDHFKDLFPDTVDVHVVSGARVGPRYTTAWVQRAPIFFMPEIRYEMSHLVDKTSATRAVYRYRLRRGDRLIASDGAVILESLGPASTRFTEYDFFNGHWGPIPAWIVWRESLRGALHSDLAIKLKAENPDWSYAQIAAEAKRLSHGQSDRLQRCFAERRVAAKPDEWSGTASGHEITPPTQGR